MDHGPIKYPLRKQVGLKRLEERKEAYLWAVCRKARMGQNMPEVMQSKKVRG